MGKYKLPNLSGNQLISILAAIVYVSSGLGEIFLQLNLGEMISAEISCWDIEIK
jgi:hypothetical protein